MLNLLKLSLVFLISISTTANSNETSVDIGKLNDGDIIRLTWNQLPVLVYKRSASDMRKIKDYAEVRKLPMTYDFTAQTIAKQYGSKFASEAMWETNNLGEIDLRSKRDNVTVIFSISTFFQCLIEFNKNKAAFFDPCSDTEYDLSGRIYKPTKREIFDLLIPPHHYQGDTLYLDESPSITINDYAPDIEKQNFPLGKKIVEAIQWGKSNLAVKLILSNRSHEQYKTSTQATALHAAASKTSPIVIKELVDAGYDVNAVTQSGITPLMFALLSSKLENAKTLIRLGAKLEAFCFNKICTQSIEESLKHYFPIKASDLKRELYAVNQL